MKQIRRVSIYLLLAFLSLSAVFLMFRIGFRLFGANPESPFVAFVYGFTGVLLIPFHQIFPTPDITREAEIDFVAIAAFLSYMVLVPLVMGIIALFTRSISEAVKEEEE